jgi:ubiquinone/menaquinone biosynthesis C-methylase UbiE
MLSESKLAKHHEMTRDIYHQQHTRLVNNEVARQRIHAMYTKEYFGLDFNDLSVLDVGCGDMAVLLIRLAQLGAQTLYGVDVGDNWIPNASRELNREGISDFTLQPGNVLNLPFQDNSFDFVACNGVLLHLENKQEIEKGFEECARVSKKYLYTTYGTGVGGLIENAIIPAVRDYYATNPAFKQLIDNIEPNVFKLLFSKIEQDIYHHTGEQINLNSQLFDEDLCVFLQNAIQPPSRYVELCNTEFISSMYEKHGFECRRLSRYVKRDNLRKLFSPLHFDREHPFSKILYGEGSMEFIGVKR